MSLVDYAATGDSTGDPAGYLVLLLVVGGLLLWYRWAGARRAARVCDRYGHAPDPDTVGTRRERCRRCGTRLR